MPKPLKARMLATIHPFRPRRRAGSAHVQFAFRIDNFTQLTTAYGAAVAAGATVRLVELLAGLVADGGRVAAEGDGLVGVSVWELKVLGPTGPVDRACARFVESVCAMTALCPIPARSARVHVSVSGAWDVPGARSVAMVGRGAMVAIDRVPFPGDSPADAEAGAPGVRSDMGLAAALLDSLACGRAYLARQPVRSSLDPGRILYEECLLRGSTGAGEGLSPAAMLPALERLGLVQSFDHHVVGHVIDLLARDPAVTLAVNISARSATLEGPWARTLERLSRRPDLAQRLVLEVTGTAEVPSIRDAAAFGRRMRRLGCRLAVDGFGAARFAIPEIQALKPDIIKTDGLLLQRAGVSPRDRAAFRRVVDIATALAPLVIVKSAASEALFDIGRESGAPWQQGYFLGEPARRSSSPEDDDRHGLDPLRKADRPCAGRRNTILAAP